MKPPLVILLFCIVFVGNCQTVVTVRIQNYDGKTRLAYTGTRDGITPTYFPMNTDVAPGPGGTVTIKSDNKGYGTTIVYFKGLTYTLFHGQNSRVSLIIDQSKIKIPRLKKTDLGKIDHVFDSVRQASIISINGDFEEVSKFYNRTVRPHTSVTDVSGDDFAKLISEEISPTRCVAIMDSLIKIELNQIDYLQIKTSREVNTPNIDSEQVRKILKNQVYAFYSSVFLNAMAMKRSNQANHLLKDPSSAYNIYNPKWEQLTDDLIRKAKKQITPTPFSTEYNDFVFLVEYTKSEYKNYELSPPKISNDELIIEKLLKSDALDSIGFNDEQTILAFKLQYLFRFLYTETFYSPVLLSAINEMKEKYPDSRHIAYFEPQIQKLKSYLKSAASNYDKAKIVETNYLKFEDLIATFKGKNIFIDIWATWCAPCIKEFKYKNSLEDSYYRDEIVLLYISVDKEAWRKKWEENIKYNQLDGFHVLANDVLKHDMWNVLGGPEGTIPRYALIDKEGKVFLANTARPSDFETLSQQINSMKQSSK